MADPKFHGLHVRAIGILSDRQDDLRQHAALEAGYAAVDGGADRNLHLEHKANLDRKIHELQLSIDALTVSAALSAGTQTQNSEPQTPRTDP